MKASQVLRALLVALATFALLDNVVVAQGLRVAPQAGQRLPAKLSEAEQRQLDALIGRHNRLKQQFARDTQADLDRLTILVRRQLFAGPLRGNLLDAAIEIVTHMIIGLTPSEAASLADYALGGIANAGGGAIGQGQLLAGMQEMQMSFNLQYLQLQSQMQHENRSYTAISNIMKTKHDTVKNSINNVR
jgi:hypothetical protein